MNLVLSPAGDNSLHSEWIQGKPNFDLVLLYYGDNLEKAGYFVLIFNGLFKPS